MSTTSSEIAIYQHNHSVISGLHLFGSRSSDNPKAHALIRTENRNMLRYLPPIDILLAIFDAIILYQSFYDFSPKLFKLMTTNTNGYLQEV